VLEIGDPVLLTHFLGIIARSKGMVQIAKATGARIERTAKSGLRLLAPPLQAIMPLPVNDATTRCDCGAWGG
jgi:DNA-binding phage protein